MWMEWSGRCGNGEPGQKTIRSIEQGRKVADELGLNFANVWPRRIPDPIWKHQNEMLGSLRRNALGKLDFIDAQ